MAVVTKTDVYVSHSPLNVDTANDVMEAFRKAGVEPFHGASGDAVSSSAEKLAWTALGECRALVVLLTPDRDPSATQMIEFGAARAWNKPIYVLFVGKETGSLPSSLSKFPAYPLNRLEDVIEAVRTSRWPLDPEDREILKSIYEEFGVPLDRFFLSPAIATEFAMEFERRTNRNVIEERLLTELLRMRKAKRLPRLRRKPA